ncbi:MAG: hypothetical protein GYB49_03375 [Alphaproteobacteria bacterium]|nr:hypothetical protein [Hyphomonas sp.]MBR9806252.1 hypothetical protein [Alphaproteobacteria bacterium]|tara:strand:- start:789 stop:1445 length:657 start_codon:yes stop_codon:yes gene_type:complete
MKLASLFAISFTLTAGTAQALEEQPESCRLISSGNGAIAVPYTDADAQLQCDIDRAQLVSERARDIFGDSPSPIITIVDTKSPSGTAYVYDISDVSGTMMLDARSVPGMQNTASPVPPCRLQTQLPENVANKAALSLLFAAEPDIPAYGTRQKMVVNTDGSRSYELLLSSHDIITHIETVEGQRDFSRHADATDKIADLNRSVIGVANFSDGWVCNTN